VQRHFADLAGHIKTPMVASTISLTALMTFKMPLLPGSYVQLAKYQIFTDV
jgi:hypothetical protein